MAAVLIPFTRGSTEAERVPVILDAEIAVVSVPGLEMISASVIMS